MPSGLARLLASAQQSSRLIHTTTATTRTMARSRGGGDQGGSGGDDDDDNDRKRRRDSQNWRQMNSKRPAHHENFSHDPYASHHHQHQQYPQHSFYQPHATPHRYGQYGYEGGYSGPPSAYVSPESYWRNGSASQYALQLQPQQRHPTWNDYAYGPGPYESYSTHSGSFSARGGNSSGVVPVQQYSSYNGRAHTNEAARTHLFGSEDRRLTAGRYEGSWHSCTNGGPGHTFHHASPPPTRPRAYTPRTHGSTAVQRPYHSQASSSNRSRNQSPDRRTAKIKMRSAPPALPRFYYVQQTRQSPLVYAFSDEAGGTPPPRPLPLLVLDLNGTLVYRGKRTLNSSTTERSRRPKLRPYLTCFLQYCLAVEGSLRKDFDEQQAEWESWDEKREEETQEQQHEPSHTHGSHFWADPTQEPQPKPAATYRLLLWSSAQPQNVDLMARAILSPAQAEQLLRVYARDTLVIRQLYRDKAPSIKDLEILWSALNNGEVDMPNRQRGERRLFADARQREDETSSPSGHGGERKAKDDLRALWEDNVRLPRLDKESGQYLDGQGYGPCNTMLLDDSLDKAAMQPFNHLLIPDFDHDRSAAVDKYTGGEQGGAAEAKSDDDASETELTGASSLGKLNLGTEASPEPSEPEDVLLQTIGVLEHARHYGNVSSWIYHGGLGDFGGVAKERRKIDVSNVAGIIDGDEEAKSAWQQHFCESVSQSFLTGDDKGDADAKLTKPRLQTSVNDRSPAFWAAEGRAALRCKGIAVRMFA